MKVFATKNGEIELWEGNEDNMPEMVKNIVQIFAEPATGTASMPPVKRSSSDNLGSTPSAGTKPSGIELMKLAFERRRAELQALRPKPADN